MKYIVTLRNEKNELVYISKSIDRVTKDKDGAAIFDTYESAENATNSDVFSLVECHIEPLELTQQEKIKLIGALLIAMNKNDKIKASEQLKEITTFIKDDGSGHDGISSLKDFTTEKQVNVVYGRIKKLYLDEVWRRIKEDILVGK